ncbi:MAG: hypothetical protein JJ978_03450 [Roseivirga sp.]|jgi:hypothetical protein|uniref:hypothetical protein n=1 Tax=Roseivirga sp. TaxID=1964215 RepID=UPI001B159BD7|nr:hypothetical protein [Roseivirga sp.]MBO6494598.1 hypothetical protein [Roseivirga sp.]
MKTICYTLFLFLFLLDTDLADVFARIDKSQAAYLEPDELGYGDVLRMARNKLLEAIPNHKIEHDHEIFLIESIDMESFSVHATLLIGAETINYKYESGSETFEMVQNQIYSDFLIDKVSGWKIGEVKEFEGKVEEISPGSIYVTRIKRSARKIEHDSFEEFMQCYASFTED